MQFIVHWDNNRDYYLGVVEAAGAPDAVRKAVADAGIGKDSRFVARTAKVTDMRTHNVHVEPGVSVS